MVRVNKKQADILTAAKDLFWKHGFKRVSIEEICQKALVSKMTFYKHFPNKIELAKAVFDDETNKGMQRYRAIMNEKITPMEKMNKILSMKLEGANNISQEFIMDFYSSSELGLKGYIEEKTNALWLEILEDSKKAQRNGMFRQDFKPEFIIYLSDRIKEMMIDEKLLRLYNTPQELILDLSNFFVYGIMPHE